MRARNQLQHDKNHTKEMKWLRSSKIPKTAKTFPELKCHKSEPRKHDEPIRVHQRENDPTRWSPQDISWCNFSIVLSTKSGSYPSYKTLCTIQNPLSKTHHFRPAIWPAGLDVSAPARTWQRTKTLPSHKPPWITTTNHHYPPFTHHFTTTNHH